MSEIVVENKKSKLALISWILSLLYLIYLISYIFLNLNIVPVPARDRFLNVFLYRGKISIIAVGQAKVPS